MGFFLSLYLGERIRDITVYLGNDHVNGEFPVICGKYGGPGENAEVVHIVCDKPSRGHFIKIQMVNTQLQFVFNLCEIRVLV